VERRKGKRNERKAKNDGEEGSVNWDDKGMKGRKAKLEKRETRG